MANSAQRELFKVLRESQNKYTYFLLAAAGAAIGFSLNQTQGEAITWSQLPLGGAVVFFSGSFFSGCRHLAYVNSAFYSNFEMLKIESGTHPEVGNHPQYVQAASGGIRQAIEQNSKRANRLGHRQFRFLMVGSILYITWHVVEMTLRAQS